MATYGDLYEAPDADFVRSGFVQHVDHPEVGRSWLAGAPWRLSGAADTVLRPSPCLGQHTEQVLADELGIGPDQYAALVAARICGTLDESRATDLKQQEEYRWQQVSACRAC